MKQHLVASIRVYLALTLLLGLAYPVVVWGIGRIAFREKSDGSLLREKGGDRPGGIVGSSLIGQAFASKKFFHGRPSAAGDKGYDALSSGGTNLGPTSQKLADAIRDGVGRTRAENPADSGPVPADAVTSSASGLDPHISPENARWQIPRVSKATGLPEAELLAMVERRTEGRFLDIFGEPRVNVLRLNLDLLSRLEARGGAR
ncbi:MAG: potassium-transporting ATPase subunit KdpC [Acidithiobacillales bacterium]